MGAVVTKCSAVLCAPPVKDVLAPSTAVRFDLKRLSEPAAEAPEEATDEPPAAAAAAAAAEGDEAADPPPPPQPAAVAGHVDADPDSEQKRGEVAPLLAEGAAVLLHFAEQRAAAKVSERTMRAAAAAEAAEADRLKAFETCLPTAVWMQRCADFAETLERQVFEMLCFIVQRSDAAAKGAAGGGAAAAACRRGARGGAGRAEQAGWLEANQGLVKAVCDLLEWAGRFDQAKAEMAHHLNNQFAYFRCRLATPLQPSPSFVPRSPFPPLLRPHPACLLPFALPLLTVKRGQVRFVAGRRDEKWRHPGLAAGSGVAASAIGQGQVSKWFAPGTPMLGPLARA